MTPADKAAVGEAAIALARSTPDGEAAKEHRFLLHRAMLHCTASFQESVEHAIRAAFDAGAESVSQAAAEPIKVELEWYGHTCVAYLFDASEPIADARGTCTWSSEPEAIEALAAVLGGPVNVVLRNGRQPR